MPSLPIQETTLHSMISWRKILQKRSVRAYRAWNAIIRLIRRNIAGAASISAGSISFSSPAAATATAPSRRRSTASSITSVRPRWRISVCISGNKSNWYHLRKEGIIKERTTIKLPFITTSSEIKEFAYEHFLFASYSLCFMGKSIR